MTMGPVSAVSSPRTAATHQIRCCRAGSTRCDRPRSEQMRNATPGSAPVMESARDRSVFNRHPEAISVVAIIVAAGSHGHMRMQKLCGHFRTDELMSEECIPERRHIRCRHERTAVGHSSDRHLIDVAAPIRQIAVRSPCLADRSSRRSQNLPFLHGRTRDALHSPYMPFRWQPRWRDRSSTYPPLL